MHDYCIRYRKDFNLKVPTMSTLSNKKGNTSVATKRVNFTYAYNHFELYQRQHLPVVKRLDFSNADT